MRKSILSLLLLASACGPDDHLTPVEFYDCESTSTVMLHDGRPQHEVAAPEEAGLVVEMILDDLRADYGAAPHCAAIKWTDEGLQYDSSDPTRQATGLHWTCTDIWIVWDGDWRHAAYSVAHEVAGHCGQDYLFGDSDGLHTNQEFFGPGGRVEEYAEDVKAELAAYDVI